MRGDDRVFDYFWTNATSVAYGNETGRYTTDYGSGGNRNDSQRGGDSEAMFGTLQMVTIATLLTLLSLATTFGNLLVIVSIVIERNLRTVTNCFIMSLAVADVTIGVISMPLFTAMILTGRWLFGSFLCDLWLSIDYAVSNASVANLIIITCDRYLNVTRPLTYRAKRTKRRAVMVILVAWVISALLWTPGIIGWQTVDGERAVPYDKCYVEFLLSNKLMTLVTAAMAFYVPVLIMLILYWRVYEATRNRDKELCKLRSKSEDAEASSSGNPPKRVMSEVVHRSTNTNPLLNRMRASTNGIPTVMVGADRKSPANLNGVANEVDRDAVWVLRRSPMLRAPEVNDGEEKASASASAGASANQSANDLTLRNSVEPSPRVKKSLSVIADAACRKFSSHSSKSNLSTSFICRRSDNSINAPRKRRAQSRSDAKAAKTISAVLLAFIVTWTPYNVFAVVRTFCGDCIADWIFDLGYLLCYINSTINPVCYAMCNENFRNAFKRIIQCKFRRRRPAQSALLALAINLARTTSAAAPQASLYAASTADHEQQLANSAADE